MNSGDAHTQCLCVVKRVLGRARYGPRAVAVSFRDALDAFAHSLIANFHLLSYLRSFMSQLVRFVAWLALLCAAALLRTVRAARVDSDTDLPPVQFKPWALSKESMVRLWRCSFN